MLYVMIGVPASGKSTIARANCAELEDCVLVSSDSIREKLYGDEAVQGNGALVFDLLYREVNYQLRKGKDVIIDATNLRRRDRKRAIQMGHDCGHEVTALYCATTLDKALEWNNKRKRHVPEDVIRRMFKALEAPTYEEGFQYINEFTMA